MKTVLSTKVLSSSQKELLLNAKVGFVEYNAIEIRFPEVSLPLDESHYIFTSKNAVKAFVNALHRARVDLKKYQCYCVGDKTRAFLEQEGLLVMETARNAEELGNKIVQNHHTYRFIYISGNLRRNELPKLLSQHNVWYQEIVGYETLLKPKQFLQAFDGVLFFSPSGIRSYLEANPNFISPAFCIGETTAEAAKPHFNQIIIANRPTTENVLVQTIKFFKEND
ncbi:MAG: uroporphyrinogen-III synthase [Bacteroidota bacterium]